MVLMKEKSELTSSLAIKKETRIKNVFECLLEYLREVSSQMTIRIMKQIR